MTATILRPLKYIIIIGVSIQVLFLKRNVGFRLRNILHLIYAVMTFSWVSFHAKSVSYKVNVLALIAKL